MALIILLFSITILQATPPVTICQLPNNLITNVTAYYKLESTNGIDEIFGNNLTYTNSPTVVTGKFASGVGVNGTKVVSRPANIGFGLSGANKATVNYWIKWTDPSSVAGYIFANDTSNANFRYVLYTNTGGGSWTVQWLNSNGDYNNLQSVYAMSSNLWYMITHTWSRNGEVAFFVNNVFVSSTTSNDYNLKVDGPGTAYIGNYDGTSAANSVNGVMDEVVIWRDRALTRAEIQYLYYNNPRIY